MSRTLPYTIHHGMYDSASTTNTTLNPTIMNPSKNYEVKEIPICSSGEASRDYGDVCHSLALPGSISDGNNTIVLKAKRRQRAGRAQRRRRKKSTEIEFQARQALQSLLSPCTLVDQDDVVVSPMDHPLPSPSLSSSVDLLACDRHYALPSVQKLRRLTDTDRINLISQLGYFPGNALHVPCYSWQVSCLSDLARKKQATRMKYSSHVVGNKEKFSTAAGVLNIPVTVELYPIVLRDDTSSKTNTQSSSKPEPNRRTKSRMRRLFSRQDNNVTSKSAEYDFSLHQSSSEGSVPTVMEPFPTLYWLTHPILRVLISQLEVNGLGATMETRLKSDAAALEQMKHSHERYGAYRYTLLSNEDRELFKCRGWESTISALRGVAGIKRFDTIKCLHAHTAHYLSSNHLNGGLNNIVGKWVMEEVERLILQIDAS